MEIYEINNLEKLISEERVFFSEYKKSTLDPHQKFIGFGTKDLALIHTLGKYTQVYDRKYWNPDKTLWEFYKENEKDLTELSEVIMDNFVHGTAVNTIMLQTAGVFFRGVSPDFEQYCKNNEEMRTLVTDLRKDDPKSEPPKPVDLFNQLTARQYSVSRGTSVRDLADQGKKGVNPLLIPTSPEISRLFPLKKHNNIGLTAFGGWLNKLDLHTFSEVAPIFLTTDQHFVPYLFPGDYKEVSINNPEHKVNTRRLTRMLNSSYYKVNKYVISTISENPNFDRSSWYTLCSTIGGAFNLPVFGEAVLGKFYFRKTGNKYPITLGVRAPFLWFKLEDPSVRKFWTKPCSLEDIL